MTINDFITRLVAEIEIILKDVSFVDYQGKQASIKGYPYELPFHPVSVGWDPEREEPDRELAVFPYFLVQIDEIEYEEESAAAKVWILLAVRDENMEMTGWKNVTVAVERLVNRFRSNPVLHDYYYCERKMKVAYPEASSWPQFFTGIEMQWNLPDVKAEL